MNKNLIDWYQQLNEEDILPNGSIKLHLPVLDADVVVSHGVEDPVDDESLARIRAENDPVVMKDKASSIRAFALTSIIQNNLTKIVGMVQPYELGSEERQKLSTCIKEAYIKLGEEIASL